MEETELAVYLKALGDPTRFTIYRSLLERKHCVRSLSKKQGISESAVSQHMKILREAGLVEGEKYGLHTHYFPKTERLERLCAAFDAMRERSAALDRSGGVCSCEYREGERA